MILRVSARLFGLMPFSYAHLQSTTPFQHFMRAVDAAARRWPHWRAIASLARLESTLKMPITML